MLGKLWKHELQFRIKLFFNYKEKLLRKESIFHFQMKMDAVLENMRELKLLDSM